MNTAEAGVPTWRRHLWLCYTLAAMMGFGIWGLVSAAASRKLSPLQVQVLSTAGFLPVVAALGFFREPSAPSGRRGRGVTWAFVTGLGTAAANVALFAALGGGADASVVFPLTGMFPLVTLLLARVFLRERLSRPQAAGVVIALLAVLLFSLVEGPAADGDRNRRLAGWVWGGLSMLALLGWGVTGVTQKLATRDISSALSMTLFVTGFVLVAAAIAVLHPVDWNVGAELWGLCLLIGFLFALSSFFLFAAYPAGGKVSVVSTLGALYPAVTVAGAVPLFGERISAVKALAILLALVAGVALSRGSQR